MITFLKFVRSLLRALTSSTAPWQMALGAWFGVMLGFLPIFPLALGPSILGFALLLLAVVINCHFASLMLFLGLGKLISLALLSPAVALGNGLSDMAAWCADVPLLHYSHLSHTGYLGLTIIGTVLAPIIAIAMYVFTVWFRNKVQPKLIERRKLIMAGKVANNTFVFKLTCWFMGL